MSSPFRSPLVRYGLALANAAVLAFVAVTFFDGLFRWLLLGVAVVDLVLVPQVLKRAA